MQSSLADQETQVKVYLSEIEANEVSLEGKVIARAIGMILDEVLQDIHSNTPGRGNRESEA